MLRPAEAGGDARRVVTGQFIRFGLVGCTNTLVSWCTYALLVRAGADALLASGVAWTLGACNSYVQNRRWTFRSRGRYAPELARFGVVQGAGLAVNLALLHELISGVGMDRLIAQAVVYPVTIALTFLMSRRWAFAGIGRLRQWAP